MSKPNPISHKAPGVGTKILIYFFFLVQLIPLGVVGAHFTIQVLSLSLGTSPIFGVPGHLLIFSEWYLLTIFGISFWQHRGSVHGSYKTHKWVKYILATVSAMAYQGSSRNWAKDHWDHHSHTEIPCTGTDGTACDPHTPLEYGGGLKGKLHAFGAWLIKSGDRTEHPHWTEAGAQIAILKSRFTPTMRDDQKNRLLKKISDLEDIQENLEVMRWFDSRIVVFMVLSLLLPTIQSAFVHGHFSWVDAGIGLLFSGLARVAAVNVATALINSWEHIPGLPGNYRHVPQLADNSNNNLFIGLFNPEFAHHNHHIFPWALNHGIYWYERILDHTANLAWILEKLGIFWDCRWVTVAELETVKRKMIIGPVKGESTS